MADSFDVPTGSLPGSGSVVTLHSGERVVVETGVARLQQLIDGPHPGRVGLRDDAGRWRWIAIADLADVEPRR